jgi:hypothetical protein
LPYKLIVLVRKPERKTTHGKPRYGWEDNIEMDLKEIEWEGVDFVHLAVVKTLKNLCVP